MLLSTENPKRLCKWKKFIFIAKKASIKSLHSIQNDKGKSFDLKMGSVYFHYLMNTRCHLKYRQRWEEVNNILGSKTNYSNSAINIC